MQGRFLMRGVFRLYLLFLFIVLNHLEIAAQPLDSLLQHYSSLTHNDPAYFEITAQILDEYYYDYSYVEAVGIGEESLKHVEFATETSVIAKIHNRLGTIYTNMEAREIAAMEHFLEAITIYIESGDLYGLGIVYNNVGNVYRKLSYDSKAIEYYNRSLKVCEQIGDREGSAFALKNLAIIYEYNDKYEKAVLTHKKAMAIHLGLNNPKRYVSSILNVGISFIGLEAFDSAMFYLTKAEELCISSNCRFADEILMQKGKIYLKRGEFKRATQILNRAKDDAINYGNYSLASNILSYTAEAYRNNKSYNEAQAIISRQESLLDSINYLGGRVDLLTQKYLLMEALGNDAEALQYYKKKIVLEDSLELKHRSEEIMQKRTGIELVEIESKLKESEKAKQEQIVYFAIITMLLLLLITVLTIYYYRKNKATNLLEIKQAEIDRKNQSLKSANSDLSNLNEELMAANETIASQKNDIELQNRNLEYEVNLRTQEIVDYNSQLEQFAYMTAHNLRGPVARMIGLGNLLNMPIEIEEQKEIVQRIMHTTQEIDKVIKELNEVLEVRSGVGKLTGKVSIAESVAYVKSGLKEEIEKENATIACDLEVDELNTVKAYIDSIMYNLVNNSIKYRKQDVTPEILISTQKVKDGILISVKDNGIGIDMEQYGDEIFNLYKRFNDQTDGRGMGLFLVKSQVNVLGGSIEVRSELGVGSEFLIRFNLN